MSEYYTDPDPAETREWLDAIEGVIRYEGAEKTDFLLRELTESARRQGVATSPGVLSPYSNTITPDREEKIPQGDSLTAMRVAAFVRWNAMAMVARANKDGGGLGGHIASFASSAVLYEVGFNWFFRGPEAEHGADLVFFQGHSAPGVYARAFVEGRLTEEQLENFRKETGGKGISSYPHPWLMPDFWQFPTVSMGLGPLMAVYQARFMKYMNARGLANAGDRKVWVFMGDGESDEPEAQGALALAAREKLDNLIYVVNCNLQRLDGPVRGNGKIIQELEGNFRGAGWNVIKLIWGTEWDEIMARDTEGLLLRKISTMVDGEFQTLRTRGPEYMRQVLFGDDERLMKLVEDKTDREIWQMSRGGHDPRKVYAAFSEARKHTGQPTVILVKTIKGFGLGKDGEASMGAHNLKKMAGVDLVEFRDRFHVPLKDNELEALPFIKPAEGSDEAEFLKRMRKQMGGPVPLRIAGNERLTIPGLDAFSGLLKSSGDREISTTMAFVRLLSTLTKDKQIGERLVPIVPDEARTFGMEGLFRQVGIYAPTGQLYEPEDSESLMWYREDAKGQILEEGITEAGAFSSWIAAATAYANYGKAMIPFYTYYSIFGFQRIGDLAWAAGDSRARGFLMGATSGRTTLNGEGLQHQDGHGLLLAATLPTCRAYDPTFSYELAVIIQNGMQRMYGEGEGGGEDVFYYITLLNENYVHPEMPEGVEEGIIKGIYQFRKGAAGKKRVQLMGSGSIFREVIAAAEMLEADFAVQADIWSVPGINQLAREGSEAERWNLLHPGEKPKVPYLTETMKKVSGPVVISTDYQRAYPEQIRRFLPGNVTILGTDGYGRSDTREHLRDFFEVDRRYIVLAALKGLEAEGTVKAGTAAAAVKTLGIEADRPAPWTV
jgi:pyruvate dehydrogenase E1 component